MRIFHTILLALVVCYENVEGLSRLHSRWGDTPALMKYRLKDNVRAAWVGLDKAEKHKVRLFGTWKKAVLFPSGPECDAGPAPCFWFCKAATTKSRIGRCHNSKCFCFDS